MKTLYVIGLSLYIAAFSAHGEEVRSEVELKQTGEPARVHSPECALGNSVTAADIVLKAGAGAIDAYIGQPVTTTILSHVPPANRDWLKVRLGIHDGKATCATVCVAAPIQRDVQYIACMSETGRDGENCVSAARELDPPGWAEITSISKSQTSSATLICASAKNWSHKRDRWFSIRARY